MSHMDEANLDVMAVGAHPDDVEIACGGTLARLAKQGYRVGIVDLTDGEPTPASPGPEVRLAEARAAAEVLGAKVRVTLDLSNRRLFDTFEARVALAKQFRKYRPRLVIGLGERTPLASPDHWQARQITEAGVFYSKLTKWDEHFDGLPPQKVPAASGLNNFLRITAGSFATSLTTTLWDRREALHQSHLAESVNVYAPAYQQSLERLHALGLGDPAAAGAMTQTLVSQGYLLSSLDLFYLSAWLAVVLIPLCWLVRRPAGNSAAPAGGE